MEIWKNESGEMHRDHDLPARIQYFQNGGVAEEEWYDHGQLHREKGPAKILYYLNGKIFSETWYYRDLIHRNNNSEDNPAQTIFGEMNQTIIEEHWYKHGLFHRDHDLPAIRRYGFRSHALSKEIWCQNGKMHRDQNPAFVEYFFDQKAIFREVWYQHGQIKRGSEDLPNMIFYHTNGRYHIRLWVDQGHLNRENDPAKIISDPLGFDVRQEYWKCGLKIKTIN